MSVVNAILANHANVARAATLVASAQRPSTDLRLIAQTRQGRGSMALTGPYIGAEDQTVSVEILAGTGAQLRTSTPVIAGVGNGALTVTAVDNPAVPETVTFRLTGGVTPATSAELAFFGVILRAKTAGPDGNDLTLTVTRNLTFHDPVGATTSDLTAGTVDLPDARWDFGATSASGAGIPLDAPRLSFDGYPQIHRHWRAWVAGAWVYRLDPALAYDLPAETAVRAVTGDYTLLLSNGTVTETYTAVTHYGFLAAVQNRSALVEVIGVVAADTAPGGMKVTDIQLRTDAYALPTLAKIAGVYGATELDGIVVEPDAVTENIQITCRASAATKAKWAVTGGASGALPDATTGEPYAAGPIAFTIPAVTLPPSSQADITTRLDLVSRATGEGEPSICLKGVLGINATAKSVTFVYTQRPSTACDCTQLPMPVPSAACLGIDEGGNPMALNPDYLSRLQALYDWRADFQRTEATFSPPEDALWDNIDMDLCDRLTTVLGDALAQIYTSADALAGWDAEFAQVQTDLGILVGLLPSVLSPAIPGTPFIPGTPAVLLSGQTVSSPILLNTNYLVSGHVWRFEGYLWQDGWACGDLVPADSDRLVLSDGNLPYVLPTYTSQVSGDLLRTCQTVTDAGTHAHYQWWQYLGANGAVLTPAVPDTPEVPATPATYTTHTLPTEADITQLARRYQARMDHLLTIAGLVPKSDASSGGGDGCWRDLGDAYYWVDSSGVYLPAFTNKAYVSAKLDADGAPLGTQEFGFGMAVDCTGNLLVGDSFTITISGANAGPYAQGDTYTIPLVGAAPARFSGGEAGSTTRTWAVSGSVGGAYPDWDWDPAAPTPYTAGPLDATLAPGGIPFETGDAIRIALEGGQLRWRVDSGAWTTGDLYATSHDLGSGLTLAAVQGPAPSFLTGDTWTFRATATHGPDRLRQPREGAAFAWDATDVTLTLDLGSVQPLTALLLALHTLPSGCTLTVSGGVTDATDWSVSPTWSAGPILATLPAHTTARYLEIVIEDTPAGGSLGWLWAGVPWIPACGVSSLQHIRQYGLTRGSGRNPAALYSGRGTGGHWAWALSAGAALPPADVASLTALIDHVAEQGLEWVCLVPDIDQPASATLAQIDADAVTFTEELGYYLDGAALTSVDLPFRAVLR